MDDQREHAEMQALLNQFREAMKRENDVMLYDQAAKERIGKAIGRASRQGRWDYAAFRAPGARERTAHHLERQDHCVRAESARDETACQTRRAG